MGLEESFLLPVSSNGLVLHAGTQGYTGSASSVAGGSAGISGIGCRDAGGR